MPTRDKEGVDMTTHNELREILKKFYIEKRTEVTSLDIKIQAADNAISQILQLFKKHKRLTR